MVAPIDKLQEINKKISEAQNKLSDIMTAINRENFTIQQKNTEIDGYEALIIAKKLEIDKAKDEFNLYLEWIDNIRKKNNEEIAILSSNIVKLKQELDEIQTSKIELAETAEKEKANLDVEIQKKEQEIKTCQDRLNAVDIELQEWIWKVAKLWDEISGMESNIMILKDNILLIHNDITAYTSQRISLSEEIESFMQNIEESKKQLMDMGEDKHTLQKEIDWEKVLLATIKDEIIEEKSKLDILVKESSTYVKAKMQLQEQVKINDMREQFLRDKYAEAGLHFN